jgi:hypothetical protein
MGSQQSFQLCLTRKGASPSSTDVRDRLNGKLHLIQAHDGNVQKDCAVCSNGSERRQKTPPQ